MSLIQLKNDDVHLQPADDIQKMGSALFAQVKSIETTAILERVTRIEALLRKLVGMHDTSRRVGCLELDLIERSAKRGERSIELLPREFRLLDYMMRHSNQLLTRAMLLAEVWNYNFVPDTNVVDVHMGRLRRKVDAPNEFPMIRNVRGAGFILRAPGHMASGE